MEFFIPHTLQSCFKKSLLVFTILSVAHLAFAEIGVTDKEVLWGVVNQQTGAIASSGIAIVDGLKASAERVNRTGGVFGRQIQIKVYDDAYDPKKAIELTEKAVKEDKVFLLTGYNGTVTVKAVYPMVSTGEVPFLFPRTGDRVLTEHSPVVFTSRAEFADETEALINFIIKRKIKRVAIISQADALGNSIKSGAVEAMKKTKFFDPSKASTPFVIDAVVDRKAGPEEYKAAYAKLADGDPEAVIVACSSTTAGNVMKIAGENKKKWAWMTTSQSNAIIEIVGGNDHDLTVSQVVPPYDGKDTLAKDYRDDMKAIGLKDKMNYLTFEAYINGRLITEAMTRAGKNLTRKSLIAGFEAKPMTLGKEYVADWSITDHRSSGKVYLSELKGNALVAIPQK